MSQTAALQTGGAAASMRCAHLLLRKAGMRVAPILGWREFTRKQVNVRTWRIRETYSYEIIRYRVSILALSSLGLFAMDLFQECAQWLEVCSRLP